MTVTLLKAQIGGQSGSVKSFKGRAAWALAAGNGGCTPIDQPAPPWSHYVFLLRRDGLAMRSPVPVIETVAA